MRTQQVSPSVRGVAVTPSNSQDLTNYSFKGWTVNSDGYVQVLLKDMADTETPLTIWAVKGVRYPDVVRRFFVVASNAATGINVYW